MKSECRACPLSPDSCGRALCEQVRYCLEASHIDADDKIEIDFTDQCAYIREQFAEAIASV